MNITGENVSFKMVNNQGAETSSQTPGLIVFDETDKSIYLGGSNYNGTASSIIYSDDKTIKEVIEENELVTSEALNDLNEKINSLNFGLNFNTIVLTLEEYLNLDTKDSNTFYLIKDTSINVNEL